MRHLIFLFSVMALMVNASFAQEVDLTDSPVVDTVPTPTVPAMSEQPIFQQLIGYAIEVSSTALTEKTAVGRYSCNRIYSAEGYTFLSEYPCEVIVHSEQGPIVVRYKDVLPDTDTQIRAFLKENQMEETLYYNNGRFRFSLEEEDLVENQK